MVVVGVRVLFKAELGVAIAIAVAFLVVLITISLAHWRNAAEGDRGGAAGAPQSSRQYTGDQYEQLRPGMSVGEVDAIMGGDGQSSSSQRRVISPDRATSAGVSFMDLPLELVTRLYRRQASRKETCEKVEALVWSRWPTEGLRQESDA